MSKYYKVFSRTLTMGKREGETVYSVRPVSNGTLTTEQVAVDFYGIYSYYG